jgi:two-component system NtrC family sensor kinase
MLRPGAAWFDRIRQQPRQDLIRQDGKPLPVEIDGAEVRLSGGTAYQFFVREVTERARLEQQLRQAEKLSAIGQMISGVAHELNNPLAVILGYIELILVRHELSDQTRADLERVIREANRAAKLVSNFLYFARERPVQREAANLNTLIRRVVELRQAEFRSTGIELCLELDAQLPETDVDTDQVQQVLVILVNNCLQALMDAPAPGRVTISTRRRGEHLEARVADNGAGVPAHLVTRIFEPFFTTKAVGTGTGLGLSIAHSIMVEHHGRITYETAPGGGACFVLEFPLTSAGGPKVEKKSGGTTFLPRLESTAPGPATVLVLDDEPSIAALMGEMLSALGHRPVLCHSGEEGLTALAENRFDLVLSDYRMPGMNGQRFYQLAVERHPELGSRFVFLTGDTVNEETRAFLDAVSAPSLTKPFHLDRVEKVIASVLRRHAPAGTCAG